MEQSQLMGPLNHLAGPRSITSTSSKLLGDSRESILIGPFTCGFTFPTPVPLLALPPSQGFHTKFTRLHAVEHLLKPKYPFFDGEYVSVLI